MKNFFKIIPIILLIFVSCDEETWESEERYFFKSFFYPTCFTYDYSSDCGINYIMLSSEESITESNNPSEFYRLDGEYGESGKSKICEEPPMASNQPIGIKSMKVYKIDGDERVDVSDQCLIRYENYSSYVSSHFSTSITDEMMTVRKMMSSLTDFDCRWMSQSILIVLHFQNEGNVYLVISLDNGTEIEQRLLY